MTQQEIQERNKQIALMLGLNHDEEAIVFNMQSYSWDMLRFHSDWNWLMESCRYLGMEFVNTDILTTFKIVSDEARKRNMETYS